MNDIESFRKEVTWFIKPYDQVEHVSSNLTLDAEFKREFPKLTQLINKARVTDLKINSIPYKLLAWDSKDSGICGWLMKLDNELGNDLGLLSEHKLLVKNIGGIKEYFNGPQDTLISNQNFVFTKSECRIGIGGWDDYYNMVCEESNMTQIDYSNFIAFAEEANGALTLYNKTNKLVFLFSHDHSFENVEFLANQPEYTFHTFKGIKTFKDYIGALADQWLQTLK